jgi:peptidoglycan/xylan/chitin deacetylase (PgdA/CDA1 family)
MAKERTNSIKKESMWHMFKAWMLSLFIPGLGNKGAILAYHSINTSGLLLTVDPDDFAKQMQYLKHKKYEVLPLSEMCERLKEGKPVKGAVSIIFYNGYSDFFTNAFPALKRNNFPATVFVSAQKLSKDAAETEKKSLKIMTVGDVKRASAANELIEFMPMTEMREIGEKLTRDIYKEVNISRSSIEKLTNKPADMFAYPAGEAAVHIHEYLKRSGVWLGAVSENAGFVEKQSDVYKLPRVLINSKTDLLDFKKKLS